MNTAGSRRSCEVFLSTFPPSTSASTHELLRLKTSPYTLKLYTHIDTVHNYIKAQGASPKRR